MKVLSLFLSGMMLTTAVSVHGEVEIKKEPLSWKQAGLSDGGELYVELCAVCHGKQGIGDGPASAALSKTVPDLTVLAAKNGGVFPFKRVEDSITGKTKVIAHGTIDMPIWGAAFEGVRPDWKLFRREHLAKQRIHNLTEYLATIQSE